MDEKVLAWHFTDGMKLRDETPLECRLYETDGEPVMCRRGFHASERIIDALRYAPGAIVSRVELSGIIVRGTDKLVATRRRVLWFVDATAILHEFACRCAEGALNVAHVTDQRSWGAIAAKRRWLAGELTAADLAAAWDAAWDAARAAARAAAWDAARDAATAAAWAAARAAARDAAWAAARAAKNALLTEMVQAAHEKQRASR